MEKIFKKGLFIIVFGVLLLPLLQQNVFFIDCGPLHGYYSDAPETKPTLKKWFDGSFQEEENNYLNDHMGLRPYLIRINNQVGFSLFQQYYGGCTLGSDNYLYYDNYIDAYYGRDYAGYNALYDQLKKLKAVQDTFSKLGKTIVAVYAPCKAWYFTEHIPGYLRSAKMLPNNYKTCIRIGDSLGIRQIDLNSWYMALKNTEQEALYPRWGIHWTNYGSILAIDTIIRNIENSRHIRMPHPAWTKVVHTTEARDPDNDMGSTLNLLIVPKPDLLCYPELFYKTDSTTTKPRIIFIGDSYSVNFIRTGVLQNISDHWQFWFVFKFVVDSTDYNNYDYIKMENYDWKTEMNKADCFVLLNTAKNANILGNGFIQAAYDYYYPGK